MLTQQHRIGIVCLIKLKILREKIFQKNVKEFMREAAKELETSHFIYFSVEKTTKYH